VISLVNHASVSGLSSITTASVDTTGATLLVLVASDYGQAGAVTPTDSKGNTWTGLTQQGTGANARVRIWYSRSPIVGSGHTFTFPGSSNFCTFTMSAWSGVDTTSPFDQQNGTSAAGVSSVQPGSVTPGSNNELIVAALAWNTGESPGVSIGSSFTITDQNDFSSGSNQGGAQAYLLQGTATAVNPTWSLPNSTPAAAAAIATFKPAAVPSATPPATCYVTYPETAEPQYEE
jgi:hypothetical protein